MKPLLSFIITLLLVAWALAITGAEFTSETRACKKSIDRDSRISIEKSAL